MQRKEKKKKKEKGEEEEKKEKKEKRRRRRVRRREGATRAKTGKPGEMQGRTCSKRCNRREKIWSRRGWNELQKPPFLSSTQWCVFYPVHPLHHLPPPRDRNPRNLLGVTGEREREREREERGEMRGTHSRTLAHAHATHTHTHTRTHTHTHAVINPYKHIPSPLGGLRVL